MVYFHFNSQQPGKHTSGDALRAIVLQIIQGHQADAETIDAISVLMMDREGKNRSNPSDDELTEQLVELFLLSISRFSSFFLVLDAIDECQGFEKLLAVIAEGFAAEKFKCVFLGRPLFPIPAEYAHLALRHSLHGGNRQDIWNYLRLRATELQISRGLGQDITPKYIADQLTPRSDSMFLWASLMIEYLRSPALSPTEKAQEIREPNRLEALDDIYSRILQRFKFSNDKEEELVRKVLQFLALSNQPPTIEQLRIVVAMKSDRKL